MRVRYTGCPKKKGAGATVERLNCHYLAPPVFRFCSSHFLLTLSRIKSSPWGNLAPQHSNLVKTFSCQSSAIPTHLTDWVTEWVTIMNSERSTRQCASGQITSNFKCTTSNFLVCNLLLSHITSYFLMVAIVIMVATVMLVMVVVLIMVVRLDWTGRDGTRRDGTGQTDI